MERNYGAIFAVHIFLHFFHMEGDMDRLKHLQIKHTS